jgi:hypothetical protein
VGSSHFAFKLTVGNEEREGTVFVSYSLLYRPVLVGFSENTSLRYCKAAEYINIEIHILVNSFVLMNKMHFNAHVELLWILQ